MINYIKIAEEVAKASKCNRAKVGCVIVKDDNIIAIGYNGTVSGSCNKCEDKHGNTKNTVLHAESNAISKCSKSPYSSYGATMYCTLSPCLECSKLIIQSGIKKVVYLQEYRNKQGVNFLKTNQIKTEKYEDFRKHQSLGSGKRYLRQG